MPCARPVQFLNVILQLVGMAQSRVGRILALLRRDEIPFSFALVHLLLFELDSNLRPNPVNRKRVGEHSRIWVASKDWANSGSLIWIGLNCIGFNYPGPLRVQISIIYLKLVSRIIVLLWSNTLENLNKITIHN